MFFRTSSNTSVIANDIQEVMKFRQKYPDFVLGYDIVGQEDRGHSLLNYIDSLLGPSQAGKDLPYFFHAGETSRKHNFSSVTIIFVVIP